MGNTVVNELNTILKGEHMAIDAYKRFIEDAKDENIKNELWNILEEHKRHAHQLSERIETLGGEPEQSAGFAGFMASAKAAIKRITGTGDIEILKKAYDGEDKGIVKAEEVVKGDLDDESMQLVNGILSEDHDHLRKMARLIGTVEPD